MKFNIIDPKSSGIYAIINILNQKMYIGSTKCFRERFNEHHRYLKNNKHHSARLQNSWNKYGGDFFEFISLEISNDFINF